MNCAAAHIRRLMVVALRAQVKNIFTGGSGAGWFFPDGFTQGGTNVARLSPAVVYNVRSLCSCRCSSALCCVGPLEANRWLDKTDKAAGWMGAHGLRIDAVVPAGILCDDSGSSFL